MGILLKNNILKLLQLLVLGAGICFISSGSTGNNKQIDQYRVQVALKLFPRIAATDQQLDAKLGDKGKVCLLIYYTSEEKQAKQLIEKLARDIPRIGKREIDYEYSNNLEDYYGKNEAPTAIFLAEPLSETELHQLMEYSRKHHRLLFSPFEGDVERGVTAGIYISNKITPYFNRQALIAADINLHQSLLSVSTHYE